MRIRDFTVATSAAILMIVGVPGMASAAPAAYPPVSPIQEVAPAANKDYAWKVSCPVERIRDTNIVGRIVEYGSTKTIAVAKANARVFAEYGIGYRLHHCTPQKFSGGGGSGPW